MGTDQRLGLAIVCSLSAMALFGLVDNLMRLATEAGSLWQFHLIRSGIALGLLVLAAMAIGVSLRIARPLAVAGRTFFAVAAMVIYFGCLGYMPISQAIAGLFTAPLFIVFFSWLFWREPVGPLRVGAALLGFIGIVLVLRPDTQGVGPELIFPVLAGACHAMGAVTTRRWCAGESTGGLLVFYFGAMMCIGAAGVVILTLTVPEPAMGAAGYVWRGWTPFVGDFRMVTLVQGVCALVGVGLLIRSYQLAEASFIGVFENALIGFAALWAILLWGEVPGLVEGAGLICIAAAGVVISWRTRGETAEVS